VEMGREEIHIYFIKMEVLELITILSILMKHRLNVDFQKKEGQAGIQTSIRKIQFINQYLREKKFQELIIYQMAAVEIHM